MNQTNNPPDPTDLDVRLAAAVAFIERGFRGDITLEAIARAAHLSPYHFHRLFRRRYRTTPKRMLNELRVGEVQRLLVAGVPPREASERVGFSHQSHMITRFKQIVGTTPGQWLKAARLIQAQPVFVTPDEAVAQAGGTPEPGDVGSTSPDETPFMQQSLRILLVEDDPDGRDVLLRLLRGAGYQVRAAASAPDALADAAVRPPDVLLSDIGLPGMDGCELMQIIRTRHGTPGIALTGFADERQRERCLAAGFARFLPKPANLADVLDAIAALGPASTDE